MNVSIRWKEVPRSSAIEVTNGEFQGGTVMIGAGKLSANRYEFSSSGEGKVTMRLKTSVDEDARPTLVRVDAPEPVEFRLSDVPRGRPLFLDRENIEIWAAEDTWASLSC